MLLADNHRVLDKLRNALDEFFAFIPELVAALLILIVGYFVAKLIGNVIARLLQRGGLDRTLTQGGAGSWVQKVTSSPSNLIGRIAFWALFLGVIALAVSVLGIEALTDFVAAIFAYLPNVIAALAIFLVAGAIAAGVAALVGRTMGDTPTGKVLATVAPGLVMAIAIFMILDQLGIAENIVTITYAALIGALALAAALAFGLGGRDVASRMWAGAYEKGQENKEQVKQDLAQGKERAREDAGRAKEAAQQDRQPSGTGATRVR
jgi:Conserved TM helix